MYHICVCFEWRLNEWYHGLAEMVHGRLPPCPHSYSSSRRLCRYWQSVEAPRFSVPSAGVACVETLSFKPFNWRASWIRDLVYKLIFTKLLGDLWSPKFFYCYHKSPPLGRLLSHVLFLWDQFEYTYASPWIHVQLHDMYILHKVINIISVFMLRNWWTGSAYTHKR